MSTENPSPTASGNGRTPRQEVGSIGWGVNLLEKTSLSYKNIPKPSVRYWDQRPQNSFIYMTGVRGAESDRRLGVDHKVFSLMNHQAQRVAVKSLSLFHTTQPQPNTTIKHSDSTLSKEFSVSLPESRRTAPTSREVTSREHYAPSSSRVKESFTSLVSKMIQNPFHSTAAVNNHNQPRFSR